MIDAFLNCLVSLPPHRARGLIQSLAGTSGRGDGASSLRGHGAGFDRIFGVARLEVTGVTVSKLGSLRPYAGMTGYDGIRQNFLTAMADPAVQAIVLDIDSPGGQVAGCLDLVDLVYEARGEKPIWAIITGEALGAAFALACSADRVTLPRVGNAAALGVLFAHRDITGALDSAGLKLTLITHGARKADAWPIGLSPEAHEAIQGEIAQIGELFAATVARNRGLAVGAVRRLEGAALMGERALAAGLVDQVAAPDAAFRQLLRQF